MTLKELQIGKSAVVDTVGGSGALRQHFLDMGLIPGVEVTLVKLAPMGDPMELRIHGYELTLRLDDAAQIGITPPKRPRQCRRFWQMIKWWITPALARAANTTSKRGRIPCPRTGPSPLRWLATRTAVRPPCSISSPVPTSMWAISGRDGGPQERCHQGPPGDRGHRPAGHLLHVPYSSEEIVTRQFIIGEKPTGIINIVDATNIERNLYLTMQLMELDTPMVLALNMMDEVRGNGGTVRINKMESMLGIPVIPISAAKNEGVDELVDHALHVAKYQERPGRMDFCSEDDHGGAVHRCIHGIIHLIEDHAKAAGIPVRFAATKLVEGDQRIEEALKLDQNEKR